MIVELKPYGVTAAREHYKRNKRYSSNKTIDAHCHLHVQEAADLVSDLFNPLMVPAFKSTNEVTANQNKKQSEDRAINLTNLDQRLKDMDRQEIDMQLLIPVPFQAYYAIRNERGHKAIQIINQALASNPFYLEWLKIQAWDGVLPLVVGQDGTPFIQIPTEKSRP